MTDFTCQKTRRVLKYIENMIGMLSVCDIVFFSCCVVVLCFAYQPTLFFAWEKPLVLGGANHKTLWCSVFSRLRGGG